MKESDFQKKCIDAIRSRFPDSIVLKNDANYVQGIPDFMIGNYGRYAFLEFKDDKSASKRPNQQHYVNLLNSWSFASLVYPENWSEVFEKLSSFLGGNS